MEHCSCPYRKGVASEILRSPVAAMAIGVDSFTVQLPFNLVLAPVLLSQWYNCVEP
jgi:hypothetical protein